ncbi:conserved hypothetical protein [Alteracholeplasma palmae J233]|uniref:GIY-YIG domain-containing protein n=1 Tax=Alteracholeplasma palmae (strain ATCC 49389 / J233) TaxID=1318466 RepID=U4KN68_ALTPJ|nr:GIY-YIG nuclease family protein [Alteracholeplasma palmae]CCV63615.1 conserved hypothetical protein [Alteracholeplasma palmae J233]
MGIKLNQLLGLTKEEIKNSKINLNMTSEKRECLDLWLKNKDVSFSYWSHQSGRKNYQEGNYSFGFVRLGNNKWLLITASVITKVPDNPNGGHCEYSIIDKYRPLFGRLIINLEKGNKYARYVFKLDTFIDNAEVDQILQVEYGAIPFVGYQNINLNFLELKRYIDLESWKAALSAVNAIYLISDRSNGKRYVGSAYGTQGLYGKWKEYLENGYSEFELGNDSRFPNKKLKEIAKDSLRGMTYIEANFSFSILETIPKNYLPEDVIKRENYYKEVLQTRNDLYGYNAN